MSEKEKIFESILNQLREKYDIESQEEVKKALQNNKVNIAVFTK